MLRVCCRAVCATRQLWSATRYLHIISVWWYLHTSAIFRSAWIGVDDIWRDGEEQGAMAHAGRAAAGATDMSVAKWCRVNNKAVSMQKTRSFWRSPLMPWSPSVPDGCGPAPPKPPRPARRQSRSSMSIRTRLTSSDARSLCAGSVEAPFPQCSNQLPLTAQRRGEPVNLPEAYRLPPRG